MVAANRTMGLFEFLDSIWEMKRQARMKFFISSNRELQVSHRVTSVKHHCLCRIPSFFYFPPVAIKVEKVIVTNGAFRLGTNNKNKAMWLEAPL